jgi:hypothetical protein
MSQRISSRAATSWQRRAQSARRLKMLSSISTSYFAHLWTVVTFLGKIKTLLTAVPASVPLCMPKVLFCQARQVESLKHGPWSPWPVKQGPAKNCRNWLPSSWPSQVTCKGSTHDMSRLRQRKTICWRTQATITCRTPRRQIRYTESARPQCRFPPIEYHSHALSPGIII